MMATAIDLLKKLAPPVRPGSRAITPGPLEETGFDEFLSLLAAGRLSTDAPVRSTDGEEPQLSQNQIARLREAAKQAESAGFARALLLVDGRGVVMNVADRTIERQMGDSSDGTRIVEVDGAVFVPPPEQEGNATPPLVLAAEMPPRVYEQLVRARELAFREQYPGSADRNTSESDASRSHESIAT